MVDAEGVRGPRVCRARIDEARRAQLSDAAQPREDRAPRDVFEGRREVDVPPEGVPHRFREALAKGAVDAAHLLAFEAERGERRPAACEQNAVQTPQERGFAGERRFNQQFAGQGHGGEGF